MDICSSPQLFAAYHVFHRLLVPRHPPCALFCLTSSVSIALETLVLRLLNAVCLVYKLYFGLLFSDVLIFNPHCLLFSCIQLNSVTLHFAVCIRPIRLHMNAILQASLQLSSLLFRQCSLFIKISFCMKFSRYKSHPLRGSFRNSFGISHFIDCIFISH